MSQTSPPEVSSAPVAAAWQSLLLFDGECGFCDRLVQWLIEKDKAGRFHYAPLQGPTAGAILARHPELPSDLDSVIYVRAHGAAERVYWRSRAIFELLRELGGAWSVVAWLRFIPSFLSDVGYRIFAKLRYRIFGRLDQCRVPTPEQTARFLP